MAAGIKVLVVIALLTAGCGRRQHNDNENKAQADTVSRARAQGVLSQLKGKWSYTRKGDEKCNGCTFIDFRNDNIATLYGPDNEFERVKWRHSSNGLHITGFKKSEDSKWTFRDSLFTLVFSNNNKSLELQGKKQRFYLKRL
jgi:hypothetical protein